MKYVLYILSPIILYFAIGLDMELFESFSLISLLCLILLVYLIHLVKKLIENLEVMRTSKNRPMTSKQAEELISLLKNKEDNKDENQE